MVSLCRQKGAFDHHPVRRELYLIDEEAGYNPALDHVVADLLRTVEALLGEGREVLIHCWAGRSRTGLAFRAWLTHAEGRSHEDARREAIRLRPHTATYNTSFVHALRRLAGR